MNFKWIITATLMLSTLVSCLQTTEIPEKGLSQELAQSRQNLLSDIHYQLFLNIPDSVSRPVEGREKIRFQLERPVKQLILDFDVPAGHLQQVKVAGKSADYQHINEHILIAGENLQQGSNSLELVFTAGDLSLNRNDDYLYSLFVPDRASTAFPCFDQPDLKASFQLEMKIPEEWTAVTNGSLKTKRDTAGHTILSFEETRPISTYLFAFVAGDFKKISRTRNRTIIHMYHKETDTARLNKNIDKIFDLHFNALQWLEEYTGIAYPFRKFAFVVIPSFQYSGMEHPGATYYRDSRVFLDESATIREKLNRANLISHETAHMWFGDLVTMEWFDQVWLKEVYANFMADKITEPQYPDVNHQLNFLLNHYPASYSVDRSRGANPVNQTLDNLNDAGTLYGDIIYHKAPIVMRNLEEITGKKALQAGLKKYLGDYAYGNATWSDLIRILEEQSGKKENPTRPLKQHNLSQWSQTWVNEPGMPEISTKKREPGIVLEQNDPAGQDRIWQQYLNIRVGLQNSKYHQKIFLDKSRRELRDIPLAETINYILANSIGKGYGYFELEEDSRDYLLNHLSSFDDALKRATLWINLWENLLHQNITPVNFHMAIVRHLPRETNPQCINLIAGYLQTNFWRFLTEKQRNSHRRETESLIWSLMEQAKPQDVRSTFFKTYRSIAASQPAMEKLYRVWAQERSIENLPLSENDYINLAYELMLKHPGNSDTIRNRQIKRIKAKERKKEFRFVASALQENQQARDRFFQSLLKEENREKEPWVSRALHYLHHPLRAEHSMKYIEPALNELKEIQRTGDIFFPKSWLDATLWGHSSPEAAHAVRQFLDAHPGYPESLENKILQSADLLFRAASFQR